MKKLTLLFVIVLLFSACGTDQATMAPPLEATQGTSPQGAAPTDAQPVETSPAVDELAAKLEGLDIEQFYEVSFRELMLRNQELIVEIGLTQVYGLTEVGLTDISDAYIRETQQMHALILEKLREYDRDALTPEQQISYDTYEWYLDDLMRGQEFMYYDYPAGFLITTSIPTQTLQFFTEIHPVASQQDAENYVTRLGLVDTKFDQLIEGLRLREQAGVIPPQFIIQWTLYGGLRDLANAPAQATPYYTAFEQKLNTLSGLDAAEKQALLQAAEAAIDESVLPGYQNLVAYLQELESKAPTDDGVWQFDQGDRYYDYTLRHHTTTDMSADEIHQMGLQELDRIHTEMRAIFDDLGYPTGESLPQLYERVANDGGYVTGDQIVTTYETLIEQADQNLSSVFDLRPSARVVVIGGPSGGAYYVPGSIDGSRPGAFFANTSAREALYSMPSLAYHEAVPGHHFQISIAQEIDLPAFRKMSGFTGYAEGWALYAERLAWELGWYDNDPYGNLGRLQYEAFRAARMVVDTGIHDQGWTFDQAQEFMVENVAFSPGMLEGEVGRYIAWPGQAPAYMVGMLKILELRQKAMDQLGDDFDLTEFHHVILSNGSMPLDVLERVVDNYIAAKLAS